jgi:3-oxocholest-4-en-26-oate---CoA ligase
MATFNLAELYESVADVVPDRVAVVTPARRLTYAELDERANRLAHHFVGAGIEPGDHIGLHLKNGTEYLEAMLGAFKVRAIPVNINYRYVERELEHLYSSMDLVSVIAHGEFVPAVEAVVPRVPSVRHVIVVDDGFEIDTTERDAYEDSLAGSSAERGFSGRSGDDLYCACTGGTTGLPKGVVWRHEDIFFASMGGNDTLRGPISSPDELPARVGDGVTMLILPPLMHVSAHWSAFIALYSGGKAVFLAPGPVDAAAAWDAVETERVNSVTVVGNAMARPLIEEYERRPTDTSSLFAIGSGGAILSPAVKAQIRRALPNILVIDGYGSTETGVAGDDLAAADAEGRPVFSMSDTTAVLDDDLDPLEPGDGRVGHLARCGRIPLGYYNDPDKTAASFKEKDGVKWVLSGDLASVEPDGSILLHGRGSVSINTGGEKVFPEEVESVVVAHPAVDDVVVVGVPDDLWGQRVVAVAKPRAGMVLELDDLQSFAREQLASYKVPRSLVIVDEVVRTPSGKPDYSWAAVIAVGR